MELLLLHARSWQIVIQRVGSSEELAKFSFIGKVQRYDYVFFNGTMKKNSYANAYANSVLMILCVAKLFYSFL